MRIPFVVFLFALLCASPGTAEDAPASDVELVPVSSVKSQFWITRSKHKADFFVLANQFEPQMNLGTCGPTSAVIVLNSLRPAGDSRRPVDASAFPKEMRANLPPTLEPVNPRYTQRAFFDQHFTHVKPVERFYGAPDKAGKRDPGIQLRQLGEMLQQHGLDVQIRPVADDTPEALIRRELLKNLATAGDYVLVNYSRKTLGQSGGGHISPLVAYDEKSDSFLVMDVNPNKAPWVWVPAKTLIAAMRTKDTVENRGYLLVREGSQTSSE